MEKPHRMINKSELSKEIWERIKEILKIRSISQVQLEQLCEEHGYTVKQPEISKLYSGRIQLTLYHVVAFSEVLDIPVAQLLSKDELLSGFRLDGKSFVFDPADEMFSGYFGNYEVMLRSTSPFEEKFLFGKLTFEPDEREKRCRVRFYLDTGEKTAKGQVIFKKYEGTLFISPKLSAAYVLLMNEQIGEISLMIFRHRTLLVKNLQCRMGMALTVASGEARNPVAQKIFISRKKITDQMVKKIGPFLKMEPAGEALLSRNDWEEWKSYANAEGPQIEEPVIDEFVSVSEIAVRYKNRKMSRVQLAQLFASLKTSALAMSSNCWLTAVSEQEDNWTYELFKEIVDHAEDEK